MTPAIRRAEAARKRHYRRFRETHSDWLSASAGLTVKTALLVCDIVPSPLGSSLIGQQIVLAKALEMAGYRPVLLTESDAWRTGYYNIACPGRVAFWENSARALRSHRTEAEALLRDCTDLASLRGALWRGCRLGRLAMTRAITKLGSTFQDWSQYPILDELHAATTEAMACILQAEDILDRFQPALVCVGGNITHPVDEIVETCVAGGIPVVTFNHGFDLASVLIKRVSAGNREKCPRMTLSDSLWTRLRDAPLNGSDSAALENFQRERYQSDRWSSDSGRATEQDRRDLSVRFGFDAARKTVGIFPRPLDDCSFLWGRHLAVDYAHWLHEAVAGAINNRRVNWFIKLHPIWIKRPDEAAEVKMIRQRFGELPRHVHLVHPSENVSPAALFSIMDWCVTGSSTVCVEASAHGIPSLTSVIGQHDRRGFTIDSDTLDDFVGKLASIDEIPPLTEAQVSLARRYAFGTFIARSFEVHSATTHYVQTEDRFEPEMKIRSREELGAAGDVVAFVDWLNSSEEDFHWLDRPMYRSEKDRGPPLAHVPPRTSGSRAGRVPPDEPRASLDR